MRDGDRYSDLSPIERLRKCREDIKHWRRRLRWTYVEEASLIVVPAVVVAVNIFSIRSMLADETLQWFVIPVILFLVGYLHFNFSVSLPNVYKSREGIKDLLELYEQFKQRLHVYLKLMEIGIIDHQDDEVT